MQTNKLASHNSRTLHILRNIFRYFSFFATLIHLLVIYLNPSVCICSVNNDLDKKKPSDCACYGDFWDC